MPSEYDHMAHVIITVTQRYYYSYIRSCLIFVPFELSQNVMAWRSSASSNTNLINNLVTNNLIHSDRVKHAMLKVRSLGAMIAAPT